MINAKSLKGFFKSKENLFKWIFILWLLTFPFGANLLPFSLGLFTVYPNLIFLVLLIGFSFFLPKSNISSLGKYYIFFFFIWLLYAIIQLRFVEGKSDAIIDIRNFILQFLFIYAILISNAIIGFAKFKHYIVNFLRIFVLFLFFIGFFETLTGIHVEGEYSHKLLYLPAGLATYAPVFIWDNPNNFMVYLLLSCSLLLLFDYTLRSNLFFCISILFVAYFFCFMTSARLGYITICSMIPFVLLKNLNDVKHFLVKNKKVSTFLIVFSSIVLLTSKLYYGPIWENRNYQYFMNGLVVVNDTDTGLYFTDGKELLNKYSAQEIYNKHQQNELKGNLNSISTRKNLVINGWEFFKESKGFGIGPGQYRFYHSKNRNLEFTGTIKNPHNWMIEIVSQQGWIILPFLSFFSYFLFIAIKNYKQKYNLFFISSILAYFIVSNLPSGFGILDINWLFLGLIFVYFDNKINVKNA